MRRTSGREWQKHMDNAVNEIIKANEEATPGTQEQATAEALLEIVDCMTSYTVGGGSR